MKNNSNKSPTVSHTMEKMRASEYAVSSTNFLSPGEIAEIYRELCGASDDGLSGCFFWGGCRGAERRAAVFLPEWYLPDGAPRHSLPSDVERTDFFAEYLAAHDEILNEISIAALRITGSRFRALSHRDYMGSILSLGVDRTVVGDIAPVSDHEAVVFVADRIAPFLCDELKKIGRDGVTVTREKIAPTWEIPRKFVPISVIVASPRLDGVVKAITNTSREDAAAMVRSGLVELSYVQTDDTSAQVKNGDIISIRGHGKFVIGAVTGETKSGRLKIDCKKYM